MVENFENMIYHHDNAPAHKSSFTRLEIELLEFQLLDNPPYSPDLAHMFFFPISVHKISGELIIKMDSGL